MDRKFIVGSLIALASGSGIAGYVVAKWSALLPPVQGAIISGVFTLISAAGAAAVVFYQLRKQGENAINANRHNEMMKLRKDVYEEIEPIIKSAEDEYMALRWEVAKIVIDVENIRKFPDWKPWTTAAQLSSQQKKSHESGSAIITAISRWRILDPRISIFVTALNNARIDTNNAYKAVHDFSLTFIQIDETMSIRVSAEIPGGEEFATLNDLIYRFNLLIETLTSYLFDLRTEMQNILLGELFGRTIVSRVATANVPLVLRLSDFDKLYEHFNGASASRSASARA